MSSNAQIHFLFLEIRDRDFNAFYDDTIRTISGSKPAHVPHLTVRGPYQRRIAPADLNRFEQKMRHAVLKIGGLGRFSNPSQEVLFLSIDSPELRDIWWKPDYPVAEYGFNPHITLYRGKDTRLVERLMAWEPLRKLEFLCAEYKLVPFLKSKVQQPLNYSGFTRARTHDRYLENRRLSDQFFDELDRVVRNEDREDCSLSAAH